MYAKSYTKETCIWQSHSNAIFHLASTDAEAVAVRMLLPLHRMRHIPESYSIVCIYVKQHQTLPILNLVFDSIY